PAGPTARLRGRQERRADSHASARLAVEAVCLPLDDAARPNRVHVRGHAEPGRIDIYADQARTLDLRRRQGITVPVLAAAQGRQRTSLRSWLCDGSGWRSVCPAVQRPAAGVLSAL